MVQAPKPASHPAVTAVGRCSISFVFSKVTVDSFNMLKINDILAFVLQSVFFNKQNGLGRGPNVQHRVVPWQVLEPEFQSPNKIPEIFRHL